MANRACTLLLLAMFALFGPIAPAGAQTKELIVAAWGGKFKAGWDKSLIPEFERKYDVKIVWLIGQNSAGTLARLVAQKGNPTVDVAMLDVGPQAQAARIGLVEKLDLARIPNHKDLYDQAFEPDNLGIGFAMTATGIVYNAKIFAENKWVPPTSWLDFFRPELKGKVAVHSVRSTSGLNMMLALNRIGGGDEKNVEPAFAKLKELKPSLYTILISGNEMAPLLQQEAVVMSSLTIDDSSTLAALGLPIKFVWPKEGAYAFKEVATIIKGRPAESQDLAYKFVDMLLSKEQQENNAKYNGFGPLNRKAELPPEVAEKVLYGEETMKKLLTPNWELVNNERARWIERFNKEIEGK